MSDFMSFRARLFAVALAVTAFACAEGPGPQQPPDEVQQDGGSDGGGGCGPGEVGCECNAGTCATGECVANVCEDCRRGEEGCICRGNGTCNTGLRCTASLCETCPAGEPGCRCATGGTCGAGLVCSNGACTPDTCTPGSPGCPCSAGGLACDGDQYCDDSDRCQACSPDVAGCACGPSGTCTGGLVCEPASQRCRAPTTCADLAAAGECKAHQACTEGPGQDAVCVAETCVANYKWDPVTQSCQQCMSEGCTAEPTCEPGDGGFADTCAAQHRLCVQAGASTSCGACVQGYAEAPVADGGSECVPAPICGTTTCQLNDYCDMSGAAPKCTPRPCPQPGQTMNSDGMCAACNTGCTNAGFTGRTWPFTTKLDVCICETREGYFLESGGTAQAVACDADGDGWVREEADDNTVRGDPALLANARCAIRKVDSVRLVDEYGIGKEVRSCRSGLLEGSDGGSCAEVVPMRLLETQRNDTPGRPTAESRAPSYGPVDGGTAPSGRPLDADELNTLTKACVSLAADFNDNGKDDIAETQAPTPGADDQARLESFAYFLELYSAFYEAPPQGQSYGTLVIKERSRCAEGFPLHHAPQDGYAADAGISYWRSCSRWRDPEYSREAPQPGFDFAQWTCTGDGGACGVSDPPHATLTPGNFGDPDTVLLRNHGLCELNGQVPADRKWRGMHHHSQFKCVNVVSPTKTYPFDRLQTDFGTALQGGKLTFNACVAQVCVGNGRSCSLSQGEGAQTRQPVVTCNPVGSPAAGALGFAAVNYRPYHRSEPGYDSRTYQGGCINEDDAHWLAAPTSQSGSTNTFTCPYPEFSLAKADADSAFGRYSCYGKGSNFLWTGAEADPVRSALHWGASATDTARGVLR